ncbi:amino acid transporter [[Actinomadura] parvosata subsp. kistnae]|nr:amino acid transporter [Actinomadura parvosata subsp. kistnae]
MSVTALPRRRKLGLWMATALVFARLGRAYPRTGGPYACARRAFGDFVG